jgi:hypothetical protein
MAPRFNVSNGSGGERQSRGNVAYLRRESERAQSNAQHDSEAEKVPVMGREEFVADFAENYTPSHVTFIGPTQRGKTTLCFQLLHAVLEKHKGWKVVFLHGKIKGRDHTIEEWSKKSNYRIVRQWPPGPAIRPKHWKRNTNGYILRPLKKDDISAKEEEKLLTTQFASSIRSNYHYTGKQVRITVVDERAQADKDLRLTTDLDAPLQRGLPHNPEWNSIQRGKWVSYHTYDAPEHIFIYKSDDSSNVERYSELGCADPEVIERVLKKLKTEKVETGGTISQCLYLRRSDRFMCIVDT